LGQVHAVIPARGGSRRIPGKNIRTFHGKPLLVWIIDRLEMSGLFDSIRVSTDSSEIAAIAQKHGAVVSERPSALSGHFTPIPEVMAYEAAIILEHEPDTDYICCVYATAITMRTRDLVEGLKQLRNPTCLYSMATAPYPSPIQRALIKDEDGGIRMKWPQHRLARTQDLQKTMYDAGQFIWGRPDAFVEQMEIFGARTRPVIIPGQFAVDIDDEDDWVMAESLFQVLRDQL
jgi:N-acylneuraminate cytidylyltransferase